MSETVLVAFITGGLSLLGTIITVLAAFSKTQKQIEVNQAVTSAEMKELTREVREHNNFAQRMPVVEEQIKVLNKDVSELKGAVKNG